MRSRAALLALICCIVLVPACGEQVDHRGPPTDLENGTSGGADAEELPLEAIDGDSLRDQEGNEYRLIGINAPDRGECLFSESASRLHELTDGITLEIENGDEFFDQFKRRLVYVFWTSGSGRQLINQTLVEEGLALAIHTPEQSAHADRLFEAQDAARSQNAGLWNPDACGAGPPVHLEIVEINSNPPGPDDERLDDEYVVIANGSDALIDLSGFTVRDESTRNRYAFPPGFELDPGASVRITSGDGAFGFGTGSPIWNNNGDTVIVLDEHGRIVGFAAVTGR